MILKMKNREPDSWIWLDGVIRLTSVPCKIKIREDNTDDFDVVSLADNSIYEEIDFFYKYPLKAGDFVNVLIINREAPNDNKAEVIVVEDYGTFILGVNGKTIDRV